MTAETSKQNSQKPAYYIYQRKESDNSVQRVGAVFNQKNGKGFNIVIGQTRLEAYPPKAQTE